MEKMLVVVLVVGVAETYMEVVVLLVEIMAKAQEQVAVKEK